MAEQTSKTARRSLAQVQSVRKPFHVFKSTQDGKPHRPVNSFTRREEAEALAAQIEGYVFVWGDEAKIAS